MNTDITVALALFRQWRGAECEGYSVLGANGSNRKYVRIWGGDKCCIAALNDDVRENEAFVYFSHKMRERGIRVPQVYVVSDDRCCYLQEDLGDTTLYNYLYAKRQQGAGFDGEAVMLYKQALSDLVDIQTRCRDLDFAYSYPRSDFDRQALQWDFNYFKYYFLKLIYIPFDEQLLEDDFNSFINYLLDGDCSSFMYRDFQTRNIMIIENSKLKIENSLPHNINSQFSILNSQLYYIDYQGARRGAPQYDAASLLYSSKAEIPEAIRQELLRHYVDGMQCVVKDIDPQTFTRRFYAYVLARIMQAMGAYGYRGLYERKQNFIDSIPPAVANLRTVLENHWPDVELPHLRKVLEAVVYGPYAAGLMRTTIGVPSDKLTVTVGSFSYKKGLPTDPTGNGGGFVFDCRALPNPGRYPEYRNVTGKDASVKAFLAKESSVQRFIDNACQLVSQSVEKYIERKFTSLQVYFGCTGGQHRSVYCAEEMARRLRETFDCHVVLHHREQE